VNNYHQKRILFAFKLRKEETEIMKSTGV